MPLCAHHIGIVCSRIAFGVSALGWASSHTSILFLHSSSTTGRPQLLHRGAPWQQPHLPSSRSQPHSLSPRWRESVSQQRLTAYQATSLVCKIAGICPNSAATLQVADLPQLQDLPQGQRRVDVGEIVDIHALGCGYYQLEFGSPYMAAREPLMHSLGPLMFMVPWADSYTNPLAEAQKFPQDSTNA